MKSTSPDVKLKQSDSIKQQLQRGGSLCQRCANAVPSPARGTGCEWSEHWKPVPGWDATPTKLHISSKSVEDSYYVKSCPKFIPFRLIFKAD